MHDVVEVLVRNTSMILPLIHTFSGCDSTSAFSGMGKERWIEVATSQGELLHGLESLENSITHLSKEIRDAFVALVSLMYVGKVNSSLNNVRHELFAKKSKTSFPQQWMHLIIICVELTFKHTFGRMPQINI